MTASPPRAVGKVCPEAAAVKGGEPVEAALDSGAVYAAGHELARRAASEAGP
jgi:hypothetical protein